MRDYKLHENTIALMLHWWQAVHIYSSEIKSGARAASATTKMEGVANRRLCVCVSSRHARAPCFIVIEVAAQATDLIRQFISSFHYISFFLCQEHQSKHTWQLYVFTPVYWYQLGAANVTSIASQSAKHECCCQRVSVIRIFLSGA